MIMRFLTEVILAFIMFVTAGSEIKYVVCPEAAQHPESIIAISTTYLQASEQWPLSDIASRSGSASCHTRLANFDSIEIVIATEE